MKAVLVIAFFSLSMLPGCEAAAKPGCETVSRQIVNFSRSHKINRICVLEFTAKEGADPGDADYISEKFVAYLAGQGKPALIERAQLSKVLKESILSAAGSAGGDIEKLDNMFSVDAVITGAVFAAGKKLKILVRLIEVKSGKVLLAGQAEEKRERMRRSWKARKTQPDDLIDEMLLLRMAKVETSGINFWTSNDREEDAMPSPQLRDNFYNLLNAYYKFKNAPPPDSRDIPDFMEYLESRGAASDSKHLP